MTSAQPTKETDEKSCGLRQVCVPGCIRYDTFYKALQFTYCGEVDPAASVPHSLDSSSKVSARTALDLQIMDAVELFE